HYEIASYGTVRTWAQMCGQDEAARLLQETLDEESQTNERLTQLAESFVNRQAEAGAGASEFQSSAGGGGRGGKSSGGKKSGGGKSSGGKKSSGKTGGGKKSRGR
ncbi:MAG TPA: DUF892 family protein, partial [Chthoniobacterales bacterium]|nr:DUF892 family protein [Chthoniobacterales bacterium]